MPYRPIWPSLKNVGLLICATNHQLNGLQPVEALTPIVDDVVKTFADDHRVKGVMTLATCNRVEVIVDAEVDDADPKHELLSRDLRSALCEKANLPEDHLRDFSGTKAVMHIFELAAGLDSAVIGEREIAGQMRRALNAAREAKTVTYSLAHTVESALQTSRRVARFTQLSSQGRSVVSVGLDLLHTEIDWPNAKVLIIGTGAYAGTSVGTLRDRGVTDIGVFSGSGRGEQFASTHPVSVVDDLVCGMAEADLVVSCSGNIPGQLSKDLLQQALDQRDDDLIVVDLAVGGDLDPAATELARLRAVDLTTIMANAPQADLDEIRKARGFVHEGMQELFQEVDRRRVAPAVVKLRDLVSEQVEKELADLPEDGSIPVEEVAERLRRMAARMMHVPSRQARIAAEAGRGDSFVAALAEVLGVEVELAAPMLDVPENMQFRGRCCPVTGIALNDLACQRSRLHE